MKKLLLAYVIGLSLCSCSFLEVKKLGKTTIDNYFTDVSAVEQSIVGLYNLTYSVYNTYQILYPDMAGDVIVIENTDASWNYIYRFESKEDDETTAVGYIWKSNYEIIINANYIIFYANKLLSSGNHDKARLEHCLAQAHFIKALSELNLSLAYSQHYSYTPDASHLGIVLINGLPSLTEKFVRSTAAQSYKDIIDNLDKAESLVHDNLIKSKAYYASSSAIKALKARVYLYMEDYKKAFELATGLIEAHTLTPRDEYMRSYTEPGYVGCEEFLSLDGYGQSSSLARAFHYQSHKYKLSNNLKDCFSRATDISKDIRYKLCSYDGQYGINLKYNAVSEWDESNRYYNIHVLRLSEMYLIRAEAALKMGDSSQAIEDLKTLKARALGVEKSSVSVASDDLMSAIIDERMMELFGEAHRLYDLTRNKLGISKPYVIKDDLPLSLSYPNDYFVLPIPYIEIDSNEIIQPNPGVNSTQR